MSDKPRPIVNELNSPYWQACDPADGSAPRLLLQKCGSCGELRCPPAAVCPRCGDESFTWRAASGRARLWSWNRFHKAYLPGFDPPYATILAKLEEGPVIISALVDADPAELELDCPLTLTFRHGLPLFTPED